MIETIKKQNELIKEIMEKLLELQESNINSLSAYAEELGEIRNTLGGCSSEPVNIPEPDEAKGFGESDERN